MQERVLKSKNLYPPQVFHRLKNIIQLNDPHTNRDKALNNSGIVISIKSFMKKNFLESQNYKKFIFFIFYFKYFRNV